MLCYTISYYAMVCYAIQYYTILYYTILYYTILYYTNTILYYPILPRHSARQRICMRPACGARIWRLGVRPSRRVYPGSSKGKSTLSQHCNSLATLATIRHMCARRHAGTQARRHAGTQARRHAGTQARRHSGVHVCTCACILYVHIRSRCLCRRPSENTSFLHIKSQMFFQTLQL